MELILRRQLDNERATTGILYLDALAYCMGLEDTKREEKVAGKTRIPAGRYPITLRTGSPKANRYKNRYKKEGMLWLRDVPGFKYVYLHIGNDEEDTEGCILVGQAVIQSIEEGRLEQKLYNSTTVYLDLHDKVAGAICNGEEVFITVLDEMPQTKIA